MPNPAPRFCEDFDCVADRICATVEAKKDTLNDILLGLYGARVTEFCEDSEGELMKRVRALVGDKMPIAITLDLSPEQSSSI
jgi:microcystin degradation protein MlrC